MANKWLIFVSLLAVLLCASCGRKRKEDKTKCPKVKAIRNFDLEGMLHQWYVIEYYASSEEALAYRCMRAEFTMSSPEVITMNFTYSFTDDPLNEQLIGNITWIIPNPAEPAHWTHSEDTYEGVYNTFVLDSDYISWALLLHCAEKSKVPSTVMCHLPDSYESWNWHITVPSPENVSCRTTLKRLYDKSPIESMLTPSYRYLSSFIMSREPTLGINVISYLRDKLPQYDIDLSFMFNMTQTDCNSTNLDNIPPSLLLNMNRPIQLGDRRHPMKHIHG